MLDPFVDIVLKLVFTSMVLNFSKKTIVLLQNVKLRENWLCKETSFLPREELPFHSKLYFGIPAMHRNILFFQTISH